MSENQRLKIVQKALNFSSQEKFATSLGIKQGSLSDIYRGKSGIKVSDSIKRILEKEFSINIDWLETGEGNMLREDTTTAVSINYEGKGVPYYDVDFLGGFDLVFNDQTTNPKYYVNFPEYDSADCWINVTGHSMEPEVSHGDMVAIKELNDWRTHILYGEMYAIITEENRTIKYVRRSNEGNNWLRLVPVNTDNYDEQDIPKNVIRKVFKVLGSAKRFQ